jgi:L-aspartate oxidase
VDESGQFALAREGGHSLPRIVHAGGAATGMEIERALVEAVHRSVTVVHENTFALDLIEEEGRCVGVLALGPDGVRREIRAGHVMLATGGAGQVFSVTTNPLEATGDGIAMALRAGVAVADIEFVQFHPTALHHPQMPRPLLSEALRGHGALLRDAHGDRFVDELLPRDEVSRAEMQRMLEQGTDHCWLDATALEDFDQRFPTIAAELGRVGLDPARDWLPIAPAAHYLCGGVITDLDGATDLPGLWAAGEVACSGVHGANRLASNSLLEGMVFGFRVVEALEGGKGEPQPSGAMRAVLDGDGPIGRSDSSDGITGCPIGAPSPEPPGRGHPADLTTRDRLQRLMTTGAGVVRSRASLERTQQGVAALRAELGIGIDDPASVEVRNLLVTAEAMVAAALEREESRGTHTRSDFPARDDDRFRVRFVLDAAKRQAGVP